MDRGKFVKRYQLYCFYFTLSQTSQMGTNYCPWGVFPAETSKVGKASPMKSLTSFHAVVCIFCRVWGKLKHSSSLFKFFQISVGEKTQKHNNRKQENSLGYSFTPCLQAVHQDWALPLRAHFCRGLELVLHDLVISKVCRKQVETCCQRRLPCIVHWWLSRYQLFFSLSTTCFLHKCQSLEVKWGIQAFP